VVKGYDGGVAVDGHVQEGGRDTPSTPTAPIGYDARIIVAEGTDLTTHLAAERLYRKHPDNSVLMVREAMRGGIFPLLGDPATLGGATKLQVVGHRRDGREGIGDASPAQVVDHVVTAMSQVASGAKLEKVTLVSCNSFECAPDVEEDLHLRGVSTRVKGYYTPIDVTPEGRKVVVQEGQGLGGKHKKGKRAAAAPKPAPVVEAASSAPARAPLDIDATLLDAVNATGGVVLAPTFASGDAKRHASVGATSESAYLAEAATLLGVAIGGRLLGVDQIYIRQDMPGRIDIFDPGQNRIARLGEQGLEDFRGLQSQRDHDEAVSMFMEGIVERGRKRAHDSDLMKTLFEQHGKATGASTLQDFVDDGLDLLRPNWMFPYRVDAAASTFTRLEPDKFLQATFAYDGRMLDYRATPAPQGVSFLVQFMKDRGATPMPPPPSEGAAAVRTAAADKQTWATSRHLRESAVRSGLTTEQVTQAAVALLRRATPNTVVQFGGDGTDLLRLYDPVSGERLDTAADLLMQYDHEPPDSFFKWNIRNLQRWSSQWHAEHLWREAPESLYSNNVFRRSGLADGEIGLFVEGDIDEKPGKDRARWILPPVATWQADRKRIDVDSVSFGKRLQFAVSGQLVDTAPRSRVDRAEHMARYRAELAPIVLAKELRDAARTPGTREYDALLGRIAEMGYGRSLKNYINGARAMFVRATQPDTTLFTKIDAAGAVHVYDAETQRYAAHDLYGRLETFQKSDDRSWRAIREKIAIDGAFSLAALAAERERVLSMTPERVAAQERADAVAAELIADEERAKAEQARLAAAKAPTLSPRADAANETADEEQVDSEPEVALDPLPVWSPRPRDSVAQAAVSEAPPAAPEQKTRSPRVDIGRLNAIVSQSPIDWVDDASLKTEYAAFGRSLGIPAASRFAAAARMFAKTAVEGRLPMKVEHVDGQTLVHMYDPRRERQGTYRVTGMDLQAVRYRPAVHHPQWAAEVGGENVGSMREYALRQMDGPDRAVWDDPRTLADHVRRHGGEFSVQGPTEYVQRAAELLSRATRDKLHVKMHENKVKVFDPRTREFGVYPFGARIDTYFKVAPGYDWSRESGTGL
jgi:hypothetical protein